MDKSRVPCTFLRKTLGLDLVILLLFEPLLHGVSARNVIHMEVDFGTKTNLENANRPIQHSKEEPVVLAFAKHFQNEMVLQREPQRANIYGFSPTIGGKLVMMVTSDESVEKDYYETVVKPGPKPGQGVWRVTLKPMTAGTTVSIRVEDESSVITLSGVIFGDVWLCSGQSNMEFTVNMMLRAKEELSDAHNYPNIRVFSAQENVSATPLDDLLGVLDPWSKPSNESLGGKPWGKAWTYFSAVCWMFGKNIHKALGIPIGLVDTNWGGTPVESWSSPDALKKCNVPEVRGPQNNSVLWNAMITPFLPMTIYGAVWYQGEEDYLHPRVDRYNCTFPAMIDDWREKFNAHSNGETSAQFPFGFVQLSGNEPDPSITYGFPVIRWHQTADYGYVPNPRMPNVFMAVAMDLPGFHSKFGSIHPQDKTDVGNRLALSGLQYAYGKGKASQGPFPANITVSGNQMNIAYNYAQTLEIRDWSGFELFCKPKEGNSGAIQAWRPTSLIANSKNTVGLYLSVCPSDQKVAGVRYAWTESPCAFKKCAVYGAATGLPGPPFVALAATDENGREFYNLRGPTFL